MELNPFGADAGKASVIKNSGEGSGFIGSEAQRLRGLPLLSPTRDGVIENMEGYEKLLDYIFYDELHVDPTTFPVLLSEVPWNPRENREWLVELFFDKYKVPTALFPLSIESL